MLKCTPRPRNEYSGAQAHSGSAGPFRRGSRRTAASSICATSTTSTLTSEPSACLAVRLSPSITRQNGHATAIWSAPVATASSMLLALIRVPSFSSILLRDA